MASEINGDATVDHDKIRRSFLRGIYEAIIRGGQVDLEGLSDEESDRKLLEYACAHILPKASDMTVVIDHRPEIHEEARRFFSEDKPHFAITFYAMWFEHWINSILDNEIVRLELESGWAQHIIRTSNFGQKVKDIWNLLFTEPLDVEYRHIMMEAANLRNMFVHYKWKASNIDEMDWISLQHKMRTACIRADAVVDDLIDLENELLFGEDVELLDRIFPLSDNP
jgi:hypothetical protein